MTFYCKSIVSTKYFVIYRWLERLVWLVLVSFHFGVTVYMVNLNLEDARANPVMTTIDTVDVTNVPFPAVTVLPGEMSILLSMVLIVRCDISIYIYPGEYPAADYEVDGFTQRLLDYAEFERYEDSDPLR